MSELAIKRTISDTISEYDQKRENLGAALKSYEQSATDLKSAAVVRGTFGNVHIETGRVSERALEDSLLKSAWYHLYNELKLDVLMTANDKKKFEHSMSNPPEFTLDNVRASFGDYVLDPWGNIVRGLAEVFCDLDQSFKSHDKVKIGVAGLPKRIIMSGFGSSFGYGFNKLTDVMNALAAYQQKPLMGWAEIREMEKDGDVYKESRGVSLTIFKNGNGHLFFEPDTLKDINRALAAYYGEVLADAHEAKPEQRAKSTAVSKDLQFYATPQAVVERMLDDLYIRDGEKILEPSCGTGNIMDGIAAKNRNVTVVGVEVDKTRAFIAQQRGHKVHVANFLETVPEPIYDRVIMNPPFYGKHYAKHVTHALKFLKDGGTLTAILPITARTDHGLLHGKWRDLPFGSFKESGTNINTTILTISK